MSININKTIGQLAREFPGAPSVFEAFAIDYCCGGNQPFEKACMMANAPMEKVIGCLEESIEQWELRNINYQDWQKESPDKLINFIVESHHSFTKKEITRLSALLRKVVNKHAEHHSELYDVELLVFALFKELVPHMQKEEMVLFPYIKNLSKSLKNQDTATTHTTFFTVAQPIFVMNAEHETAGELLTRIREVTSNFTPPSEACNSYKLLYQGLSEFEKDLHRHIHLENNILFPRALEMEDKVCL